MADLTKLRKLVFLGRHTEFCVIERWQADPAYLFHKIRYGVKIYGNDSTKWPQITSLDALASEFEQCIETDRKAKLKSTSGKDLFDADDLAILGFLKPASTVSTGPGIIQSFRKFHDPMAGNFVNEIIQLQKNKVMTYISLVKKKRGNSLNIYNSLASKLLQNHCSFLALPILENRFNIGLVVEHRMARIPTMEQKFL